MKIQVYGSGCDKCKKLTANVETAGRNLGVEIELEKVSDINAITDAGIMMTPALTIDGKVVSTGKVLSPEEIAKLLQDKPCSCGEACNSVEEAPETEDKPCCCCGGGKSGKKILTAVLLLFVLASMTFAFIRESREKTETVSVSEAVSPMRKDVLTVYYFHGNMRCMTCNKFENLTREIVQSVFTEQLASGTIVLKFVNVEAPGNEHFIQDFQLTTKSVVLQKNGQYKNLDQIWTLVRKGDNDFKTYVKNEIKGMLE